MEVRRRKKAALRQNSNVFALFSQSQIAEFKEAFSMIDHDNDGFIDQENLTHILYSLGHTPNEEYIESMMADAPGPINFTMFLTLFGERLSNLDPEHEITQAFEAIDVTQSGLVDANELRDIMTKLGDRFTDDEFDHFMRGIPLDRNNCFDYRSLVHSLKQS